MPQTSFIAHVRTSNGWTVPVTVTRKHVRRLNLRVRGDGSVALSIPWYTSETTAQNFLERKAEWIRERVERRTARAEEPLVPMTGADTGTLPLWGHLVDAAEALGLEANELSVLSPEELQKRIDALCRREVMQMLPGVVARVEATMPVHATRWSVRRMRTRWGSCTPKSGAIRINSALAAYPPECLDYVVVHELTHLMEPSHNARFHALLDRYCPENRKIAALLKHPAREAARP